MQKIRELFHNLCRETQLSRTEDYLKFGNIIQLIAPDMPSSPPKIPNRNYGVTVSVDVPREFVGKITRFGDGAPIVCSPNLKPCTRNTFTIKSANCHNNDGNNLLFGQEFVLQASKIINPNNADAIHYKSKFQKYWIHPSKIIFNLINETIMINITKKLYFFTRQ